jgi:hypothetical protein
MKSIGKNVGEHYRSLGFMQENFDGSNYRFRHSPYNRTRVSFRFFFLL